MNTFTLVSVAVLVVMVGLLIIAVRDALEVDARNARAQARGEAEDAMVNAVFDHIEQGIAKYDAQVKAEYAEQLRVLGSLCCDMEGTGYIDQYQEFMLDWVAYGEQEPCTQGLKVLRNIVKRAHMVFEQPVPVTSWMVNRNTLRAISEVYRGSDGITRLVIRDELVLDVVYDDEGVYVCTAEPKFAGLAREYALDGDIERVSA